MNSSFHSDIARQAFLETVRRMAEAPFLVSVEPRRRKHLVTVHCRQTGRVWGQTLDLADPEQREKFRRKLAHNLPTLAVHTDAVLAAAEEQKDAVRRARRQQVDPKSIVESPVPMRLADHFLKHAGMGRLIHWRGDWYEFSGSYYALLDECALSRILYNHLDRLYCPDSAPERQGDLVKINPNKKMIDEVRSALPSRPGVLLSSSVEQPAWIEGRDEPDPDALVVFPNGLLDPETGQLMPSCENLFATSVLGYRYDPQAKIPERFHRFLAEVFQGDEASIAVLQELFGYILSGDRSLQKIPLMIGGKRSGKGTCIRVLTALVGAANVCNPSMGGLASQFGMSPLIGKKLAVITDARLSNKADLGRLTETLLCISGEDDQTIDRKYKEPWTGRLRARIIIASNAAVPMNETSGALASRFVVIKFPNSFLGRENPNLTNELLPELPGILLWAMDGLKRLRQRGRFEMAASGQEEMDLIEDLLSPMKAFVKECTTPGDRVTVDELYAAYGGWCRFSRRESVNRQRFGMDLRSCVDGLRRERGSTGERRWCYKGIQLNPVGARLANLERAILDARDKQAMDSTETEKGIERLRYEMEQLQWTVKHQMNDPKYWVWRQKEDFEEMMEKLRKMFEHEAGGTAA